MSEVRSGVGFAGGRLPIIFIDWSGVARRRNEREGGQIRQCDWFPFG